MSNKSYSIQLSADREGLIRLYDFMSDVSVFFDLDDKTRFEIELAVEEAVTNIITHAYKQKGGDIILTLSYHTDELRIIIQDWGDPLNEDTLPDYDSDTPVHERVNGGMGLHFMRTLMDSVKFSTTKTRGTVLTMTKRYKGGKPPPIKDELELFEEVSRALSSAHNVDAVLYMILNKMTQVVRADRGTLYLVDFENNELYSKVLQATGVEIEEIRLKVGEGIAGHVAKTGETVNIRSVQDDPNFAAQFDQQTGYITETMICTPMRNAENKVIGVVQLINKVKGHFTARDESLLNVLASQAAIAYENARLIESEQNKRQLADTLREVAAIINSSLDMDKVLDLILGQLERVIPFKNASILLIENDYFVVRASRGVNATNIMSTPIFRVDESDIFEALRKNDAPLVIKDIQVDDRWIPTEETSMMRGWMGTLLQNRGDLLGEIAVIHDEYDFYNDTHADTLSAFANQAAAAIERARLHAQTIQQARLRQELETAFQIQTSLLPKEVPQPDGWQIASTWQPATEVGGDFYDFLQLDEHRLGFVIADVSGKGVPAALFMTLSRTIFRTLAFTDEPLEELMANINHRIYADNRARLFVTLFYGILDTNTGRFDYVNAGHNPPLLLKSDKERGEDLETCGPALGFFDGAEYEHLHVQLDPQDMLVMYTDGIVECINLDEIEFGERRLFDIVYNHSEAPAATIIEKIKQSVIEYTEGQPAFDDSTVIVIKRR